MDTEEIVARLRQNKAESTRLEVKSGAGGLPVSLRETLSAFANKSGGTVLVGLSEPDFLPVDIDAQAIRDGLMQMMREDLEPSLHGDIEIETLADGSQLVRLDVDEIEAVEKPCFVKAKGEYRGSYIRVGDGDFRLNEYEISRLRENRKQPEFDLEVVLEATLEDLDDDLVNSYVGRVTTLRPRAFSRLARDEVFRRLRIAVEVDGVLHPTLAALLVFGLYPQQFFPQLSVTFVSVPGTQVGDLGPNGERFLDNVMCEGPIPTMLVEATHALTRNMARASIVSGLGRQERLEYPLEVMRELLINAMMHRDYSPGARGSQIQVELYLDRLVVRSPGGIYGPVDPKNFGEPDVSSSRNATLARMLEDTQAIDSSRMLAENRGSGIPTVLRTLYAAGMAPPEFDDNIRRLQVTIPHDALLTPEVLEWIEGLGQEGLTQSQVQAIAVLRQGGEVRNRMLQNWGLHPSDATRELNDLVARGLLERHGSGRGSSYVLAGPSLDDFIKTEVLTPRQLAILLVFRESETVAPADLANMLGISRSTLSKELRELLGMGLVRGLGESRSRERKYAVTARGRAKVGNKD